MRKPISPCKGCDARAVGCKTDCVAWKVHQIKWERWKSIVNEEQAKSKAILLAKGTKSKEILH